uniref:VWFA domain-containing protein n=1 Tax=Plectus sambesii TaxID=2011161 RepID=A0A914XE90_9BILA
MQQNFFGLQGMEQLLAQIPLLSSFYYQTFALIVFDENQYSTVISTTDFAAFQRALQSELIIAQETPIAADQRVKVVEAISLALQNDQNSYGSIFVFTESLLIDDQNDSAVFRLIEFDKAQVHIYFSTSSSLTSAGIKNSILYDIAAFSGGSIVIGRSGVAINYISSFLPAAHDTIGGDVQFSNNCINGGGQNFTVNVDGTTKYVVLIATGAELTPQLIISDGEMNSYGSLIVAQLLTNGTNQNGLYTVNIRLSSYAAANSQCFLFSRINSDTSAFFGVTSSPTDDFTDSSISISPTNYILSHVSTQFGVYNLQAKLFDYENSSLQLGNSISFDNRPSDVCSYEFQSQQFSCPTTTSGRFRIQVSGMLNGNVQFTRSSFSQCNVISECINGQLVNGTCACNQYWRGINCEIPLCINGGTRNKYVCKCAIGYHGINCQFPDCDVSLVEVDLTILTDSSATITYAGFNGVKNMLIEFLEQGFTISDTKMRIALIHVSDFAFYFKQINVQNNFNETRSLLLRDFYVQGRKGPAFFRGLSLVIDSENLLRPDVKRLTVLISGSNAGDGTNVTQSAIEVGALRQAGIGVYGITFGPYVDANDTELRAILGGPQYISDVYSYGTQSQTISWLTDLVCPQ